MIDRSRLTADLSKLLPKLEDDLRERCEEVADIDAALRREYEEAREAKRTAHAYKIWRDERITQVAVAWVLSCVFTRFLEDNELIEAPRISGPVASGRLRLAIDYKTHYVQQNPTHNDKDYLESVFRELAAIPALAELFDARHNLLWQFGPSQEGAKLLLDFFQALDEEAEDARLEHDFTDPTWDTRFLGDLYQDLSEDAQKKYALKQTPVFVEEFILDRTMEPAIKEFGLDGFRMLDPTVGSGHFLLGGFARLLARWQAQAPGEDIRTLVQRALGSLYGVDLNPYAVAIARFRLLVAAMRACDIRRIRAAPDFEIHLAVGDSLLHGRRYSATRGTQGTFDPEDEINHFYASEIADEVRAILSQQFHAVVGNPPYIIVRDRALNQAYRDRYGSCCGKYSLAVPFMERFVELAVRGEGGRGAGFVGMITANSFMKREFGKKLIEQFIPRWNLTHVIDTSGAYIPGHGTPTVILFLRNEDAVGKSSTIRAVMGIRGEPSTPEDPARGLVWSAILDQIDRSGSESEFVSVEDKQRAGFAKHPWSIGGGGAADLKEQLDEAGDKALGQLIDSIGFASFPGLDDAFVIDRAALQRKHFPEPYIRAFITGEVVRDWSGEPAEWALSPYDSAFDNAPLEPMDRWAQHLWSYRICLRRTVSFGGMTREQLGHDWWVWYRWIPQKYRIPLSIAFAFVASHNHFVLDRGGKVFNRSAPVIKLPPGSTEDDHLALLGLLNSSTACFWMKQVSHQKQLTGGDGVRVEAREKVPYEFAGTQLANLPIPGGFQDRKLHGRLLRMARHADVLATELSQLSACHVIEAHAAGASGAQREWQRVQQCRRAIRAKLILVQEEIDFIVYAMFGLADATLLLDGDVDREIQLDAGMRPYEIISGKNQDGFEVSQQVPQNWPADIQAIWQRRMDAIGASHDLQTIEDPHYKRRWIGRQGLFNITARQDELQNAAGSWLLDRIEALGAWRSPCQLTSVARLTDLLQPDADFCQVAELYRGQAAFDLGKLVAELLESEHVPFLPVLRYKPSGLRKREAWEDVWRLQRLEDAIDARCALPESDPKHLTKDQAEALKKQEVGEIPVPPKYVSGDFLKSSFWSMRGKLDVPKERFVSYPHCNRDGDETLLLGWAGWDHLQQIKALASHYREMKEDEGWEANRLTPLLGGLLELLPWVKQWHNDPDPEYGGNRLGDFFEEFIGAEAHELGLTVESIRAWSPPARRAGRKSKVSV